MIEDAVKDRLHAAPVHLRLQGSVGRVAAERRIDMEVVVGVIAVVRPGLEDRIHIDGVHTQALQIVEFVLDAKQIAAEELVAECARTRPVLIVGIANLLVPVLVDRRRLGAVVERTSRRRAGAAVIVGLAAVAEAVREDVIHIGVLQPRRRLEVGIVHGELE